MKGSRLVLTALLAAACAWPLALVAGPGQGQGQRVYTYAVQIDADGHVQEIVPYSGIGDAVGRELEAEARTWLFSDGGRSGRGGADGLRTFLRLVVAPGATPGHYELLSATTGPAPRQLVLPQYPVREQREGREGAVVMKLDIGPDGRVTAAEVDSVHGDVSRNMTAAARRAALQWRFAPERVGAQAVGSTVLWPVCFLGATTRATECAWSGPEAQRYSSKMVLPLDPVARRVTPLAFEGR